MTLPRVLLIGGAPGAGKTTLGRALAIELGWTSLSVDDLMVAAKAVTTPESHPGFHVMNRPDYIEYFTRSSVDQLIADADLQMEARERKNVEFVRGSADPERMRGNFLGRSLRHNDLIRREATRLGLPILVQDGGVSVQDLCSEVLRAVQE